MRPRAIVLLLISLLGLSACAETQTTTYPLSGQPCSPDDPVQDLTAEQCAVPM